MPNRFVFITLCTILMAAFVFIVGQSLRAEQREARLNAEPTGDSPSIPVEAGMFRRAEQALTYLDAPMNVATNRDLDEF